MRADQELLPSWALEQKAAAFLYQAPRWSSLPLLYAIQRRCIESSPRRLAGPRLETQASTWPGAAYGHAGPR
jgi:hypothetical protein